MNFFLKLARIVYTIFYFATLGMLVFSLIIILNNNIVNEPFGRFIGRFIATPYIIILVITLIIVLINFVVIAIEFFKTKSFKRIFKGTFVYIIISTFIAIIISLIKHKTIFSFDVAWLPISGFTLGVIALTKKIEKQ